MRSWLLPVVLMGIGALVIITAIWWTSDWSRPFRESIKQEEAESEVVTDDWVDDRFRELERPKPLIPRYSISGEDAAESKQAAEPKQAAEKEVVEEVPTFSEAVVEAERLLAEGKPNEAGDLLEEAAEFPGFEDGDFARYESLLGIIRLRQGRAPDAVAHLIKARKASPGNLAIAMNLADSLRASGMLRLTEAALLDALEISPDGIFPNVRYRYFLIQTGRKDRVVEEIRAVPESERDQIDVLAVAAGLHADAGSYEKVQKVVVRLRELSDDGTVSLLLADPIFRNMPPITFPAD